MLLFSDFQILVSFLKSSCLKYLYKLLGYFYFFKSWLFLSIVSRFTLFLYYFFSFVPMKKIGWLTEASLNVGVCCTTLPGVCLKALPTFPRSFPNVCNSWVFEKINLMNTYFS